MAALQHVGAAASGDQSRPAESDEAPVLAGAEGFRRQAQEVSLDFAAKRIVTATARVALLGIEVRALDDGAWLLRHAFGADIGIVHGEHALVAAVAGFEAATRDVRELVQRMRSAP